MNRGERKGDLITALRTTIRGAQANIWTALPGIVVDYQADVQTCSVQPAVQVRVQSSRGIWTDVSLPVVSDVPVQFPRGGGFALTLPIAANDEGILVVASRCIDLWWQSGKVSRQVDFRMHDLSDGMFIPGITSQPRKLANVSTTAAQLRSVDGAHYLELGPSGFKIVGPLDVTGAITATGDVTALLGSGQITMSGHLHTSGGAGAPTSPPTPGH